MKNSCTVEECTADVVGGGLCRKHYMRKRRTGTTEDRVRSPRPSCTSDGCDQPQVGRGLCRIHYMQMWGQERTDARRASKPELACAQCGKMFKPLRYEKGRAKFCSKKCKEADRRESGKMATAARKHHFQSRYRLTVEQVEEMAEAGCGICGTTDWPGRHQRPHVDHDHKTNEVRGILCSECNTGLGKFKDDPALLEAAVRYLAKTVGVTDG